MDSYINEFTVWEGTGETYLNTLYLKVLPLLQSQNMYAIS